MRSSRFGACAHAQELLLSMQLRSARRAETIVSACGIVHAVARANELEKGYFQYNSSLLCNTSVIAYDSALSS